MNVAINFGNEYFCFVIYYSKIFFVKTFFQHFFFKIFFQHFFSKIFFSNFISNLFLKFIFEGFTLDTPVYRDKTDSMYLCYEKYDIQQAVEIGL